MTSETDAGGSTATYAYDGEGRRIKKTVNGLDTVFVYDPFGNLAQEYNLAGVPPSEAGTRYLTTDHLGSTRLVTKQDGTVAQAYDYLPFGTDLTTVTDSNRIRFTSKERDAETGLDFFEARYFSSSQGRFTSPDEFKGGIVDAFSGGQVEQPGPLPYADIADPQTLNKYSYVRNNPLRYVDPDGHAFGLDDLIGASAGALVGVAVEVGKDVLTGEKITTGAVVGAAVGGALFGEGIVNAPETLGGSVVLAAAAKGAVQGAVSNTVQQVTDIATGEQKEFKGTSLAVSAGVGAISAGVGSKIPSLKVPGISSGSGNMKATAEAVRTKIAKGIVENMSVKTAVKGAIGGQVANAGKTAAEAAADVAAKKSCNAATSGACE